MSQPHVILNEVKDLSHSLPERSLVALGMTGKTDP